jgi:hypothetical protein
MVLITLVYYNQCNEKSRLLLPEQPKGVKQLKKLSTQRLPENVTLDCDFILLYKDLAMELDTEDIFLTNFYKGVDQIEILLVTKAKRDQDSLDAKWKILKATNYRKLINSNDPNLDTAMFQQQLFKMIAAGEVESSNYSDGKKIEAPANPKLNSNSI